MTEWQDDIYIQLFRLPSGTALSNSNSAIYSTDSYYYSRETDDGDFAGRMPVDTKTDIHLVMINYNEEEEQSLKLQYGGAMQTAVVGVATLAASLAATFLF
eukprot:CAMPEP_0170455902 /NCGR_PEP_ID=MMETSP0123-20130129/3711_1 /TAXON_ID=182087 /ORGANISM="Favella ehrenbergii, Strain Fehren 1" /LENGTH=100 /DNA_ID=CAMNT_0010719193 /DNA_START=464 /DNA_END=766 /DNA_ORIENTATION=-